MIYSDPIKEQQKADFMEHLYEVYQPANHLYTGLWERFKEEAAEHCRNEYFAKLQFIKDFQLDVAFRKQQSNL
ncbi:hypothetical protein EBQ91_01565 [bacterium]|nr:hypothetical protein [bacterium]